MIRLGEWWGIIDAVVVGVLLWGTITLLFPDKGKQDGPAPKLPTANPQKWCPPVINGRVLDRSIYREPDRDEAALACFYRAPKERKL